MKIVIQCSDEEHGEALAIDDWIGDGEFDAEIEIEIVVQN